jgi:hypothetical protein
VAETERSTRLKLKNGPDFPFQSLVLKKPSARRALGNLPKIIKGNLAFEVFHVIDQGQDVQ